VLPCNSSSTVSVVASALALRGLASNSGMERYGGEGSKATLRSVCGSVVARNARFERGTIAGAPRRGRYGNYPMGQYRLRMPDLGQVARERRE
jgi:hypothetical protein